MHPMLPIHPTIVRPFFPIVLSSCLLGAMVTAGACAKKEPPVVAPPPVEVSVPSAPPRPMPTPNRQLLDEARKAGLEAREVDEGVIIYLPTVFLFTFDSSTLTDEARKQLREVARLLTSDVAQNRHVTVEGHADAVGSRTYNRTLSDRRASLVMEELVAGGVKAERISKRVFGEDKPLEPNRRPDGTDNPEGRAKNRRVALLIENASGQKKSGT